MIRVASEPGKGDSPARKALLGKSPKGEASDGPGGPGVYREDSGEDDQ